MTNSHRFALITGVAACLAGAACSRADGDADAYSMIAEVVAEYPHDAGAFTQGLAIHEGRLFEGTGLNGASSLREVDLETGRVQRIVSLNRAYFGEGVTVLGDRVYQLTWRSGIGAVYDLEKFEIVDTFNYSGEGWGLTHDGELLILSDGTSRIRFIDPDGFAQVRTLDVHGPNGPVDQINELEYIRGEIWANVWHQDYIVRIDPETGLIVGTVDLSGFSPAPLLGTEDVANGIAFDVRGERIFVTGKRWPRLYEIRLVPTPD